jgi:hypothetical protein
MAIANAVLESERMQRLKRAAHHAQQHDHHHDGDEYNSDDEIGYGDDGDEQSPLLHDIDADSIGWSHLVHPPQYANLHIYSCNDLTSCNFSSTSRQRSLFRHRRTS